MTISPRPCPRIDAVYGIGWMCLCARCEDCPLDELEHGGVELPPKPERSDDE